MDKTLTDISREEAGTIIDFLGMYVMNESAAVIKALEGDEINDDEFQQDADSLERLMLLRNSLRNPEKTSLTPREAHDLYYALWFGVLDLVRSPFGIDNLLYVRNLGNIMERCERYCTEKAVSEAMKA